MIEFDSDDNRPADLPAANKIAFSYPADRIKDHFLRIVKHYLMEMASAELTTRTESLRDSLDSLRKDLDVYHNGEVEIKESPYTARIIGMIATELAMIEKVNKVYEFISDNDNFKLTTFSSDNLNKTIDLMSWFYLPEERKITAICEYISFPEDKILSHFNGIPYISAENISIKIKIDKRFRANSEDLFKLLDLATRTLNNDVNYSNMLNGRDINYKIQSRARADATFSTCDHRIIVSVRENLAIAMDLDYEGISYAWKDEKNKHVLIRVGAKNLFGRHDDSVFKYKEFSTFERNYRSEGDKNCYFECVSIADIPDIGPTLALCCPETIPLSFIFDKFRANFEQSGGKDINSYLGACKWDENNRTHFKSQKKLNANYCIFVYSIDLSSSNLENSDIRFILRFASGRLATRMGGGVGPFSLSRCDPKEEYSYRWCWQAKNLGTHAPSVAPLSGGCAEFQTLIQRKCELDNASWQDISTEKTAQCFNTFPLHNGIGFRLIYRKEYKDPKNTPKRRSPEKRAPRMVGLEASRIESPAAIKRNLSALGLLHSRNIALPQNAVGQLSAPDRLKNKGGIGTVGYSTGYPMTRRVSLGNLFGTTASRYFQSVVKNDFDAYLKHMLLRENSYYCQSNRINNQTTFEQVEASEELVAQEWCHLVGHGDRGDDAPYNIVSGSFHANTEQLAIETGMRALAKAHQNILAVKVTAYMLPLRDDDDFRRKSQKELDNILPAKTGQSSVGTTSQTVTYHTISNEIHDFFSHANDVVRFAINENATLTLESNLEFSEAGLIYKYSQFVDESQQILPALRVMSFVFGYSDLIAELIIYGRIFSSYFITQIEAAFSKHAQFFTSLTKDILQKKIIGSKQYYERAIYVTADSHSDFKTGILTNLPLPQNAKAIKNTMHRLIALADYYKYQYSDQVCAAASFIRYVITDRQSQIKIFEYMYDAQRENFDTHQSIYLTLLTRYHIAKYLDIRWINFKVLHREDSQIEHVLATDTTATIRSAFHYRPFLADFVNFLLDEVKGVVAPGQGIDAHRREQITRILVDVAGDDGTTAGFNPQPTLDAARLREKEKHEALLEFFRPHLERHLRPDLGPDDVPPLIQPPNPREENTNEEVGNPKEEAEQDPQPTEWAGGGP